MDFIVQVSSGDSQKAPLMVPLSLADYEEWEAIMPYRSGNDVMCALFNPRSPESPKSDILAVWRKSGNALSALYGVYEKYRKVSMAEFLSCVIDAGQKYFNTGADYADDMRRELGLPTARDTEAADAG